MGHKEARKPDRFNRWDDSLKGYQSEAYLEIERPDTKTGTLEVTKGQELLEKRPIATARNVVDPEILQRWNDKRHMS